jgi:VanZ family protein
LRTVVYSNSWHYWAAPIIWALAILALSGNIGSLSNTLGIFKWVLSWLVILDSETIASVHFYSRKTLHVICYGFLTLLWFRALMASCPERLMTNRILALALCLIVALADEGHQSLVPSRTGSWADVRLDMIGGLLFLFLSSRYWK